MAFKARLVFGEGQDDRSENAIMTWPVAVSSERGTTMCIILRLVMTILLVAVFSSCGDGTTGPTPAEEDWLPLAVGNWWNGDIDGWFISYTDADTVLLTGSFDRRVESLQDHQGGFQVYEFVTYSDMVLTHPDTVMTMMDTTTTYLRNTGDEMRGYVDTISEDYELMARFPLTLLDEWYPWPDSTQYTTEVVSLSASITVPAGAFNDCAILRDLDAGDPTYQWDHYFHRGTGMVRDLLVSDELRMDIQLNTFSVQ